MEQSGHAQDILREDQSGLDDSVAFANLEIR